MRRVLLASALALATGFIAPVQAADQDFTLVNRTGYQIDEVYVSPSSSNRWGRDVMGQDVLENSARTEINFPDGTRGCNWDLKVIYNDRDTAEWRNLNLCSISRVTLFYDRKSGHTRAETE
jgi:hypothetical protein